MNVAKTNHFPLDGNSAKELFGVGSTSPLGGSSSWQINYESLLHLVIHGHSKCNMMVMVVKCGNCGDCESDFS